MFRKSAAAAALCAGAGAVWFAGGVAASPETEQCKALIEHVSQLPHTIRFQETAIDGPSNNPASVTVVFEWQNPFGATMRDRATCFYDQTWRDIQVSKKEAVKAAYGLFSMERVCLPGRCLARWEVHSALYKIEEGIPSSLRPRTTAD